MTSAPPSSTPADGGATAPPLTRLRHEYTRGYIATGISLPLSVVANVALELAIPGRSDYLAQSLRGGLLFWVFWSIGYAVLTVRAFGGATAESLPALVSKDRVPTWQRVLAGGADGPGFAVQFAALALAAAALLPRLDAFAPAPGEGIVLIVLIVATVIGSWTIVTLSYAVHYARRHIAGGGLDFPGDERPDFRDYFYFSASVATTFGTTDVEVTTTRMRGVVTGHSILTFVFNTVIIALMVSALTA